MGKRVIIGTKSIGGVNTVGMWVSAPGKDAGSSTAPEDFLVDTTRNNLRPVMAGVISQPTLSENSGLSYTPPYAEGFNNPAAASNGHKTYTKYYNHNLGYIPVCFFSIGSSVAGEIYPTIQITSTQLILYHRQNWNVGTTQYQDWSYSQQYGLNYAGFVLVSTKPSSITYSCDIHYTFYGKSTGL